MFLELKNVTKVFESGLLSSTPPTVAVNNLSLSIDNKDPKILTVAGESGSGKTTLSRLLLGSITPTNGEMFYKDKNFKELSRRDRRAFMKDVQPIFQDPFASYNPFYRIDHVLFTPIKNFGLAGSKADQLNFVTNALEMVGLRPDEILGRFPHQLSGGQRQRIMVARALLLRPSVILADEPVSMVDASLRATILESISILNKKQGISIVYVTHDLTTAYQISDSIMIMYKGFVMESGQVEKVIHNPQHPYTRLLIDSIPQANPEKRWAPLNKSMDREYGLSLTPPLLQVEEGHWVRNFQ